MRSAEADHCTDTGRTYEKTNIISIKIQYVSPENKIGKKKQGGKKKRNILVGILSTACGLRNE
jgi:hypothetical protein